MDQELSHTDFVSDYVRLIYTLVFSWGDDVKVGEECSEEVTALVKFVLDANKMTKADLASKIKEEIGPEEWPEWVKEIYPEAYNYWLFTDTRENDDLDSDDNS